MFPYNNPNGAYNPSSNRPSSSNQHVNNNASSVPGQASATGGAQPMQPGYPAGSYNPQANVNNAQYAAAVAAGRLPAMQGQYGQQQPVPQVHQQPQVQAANFASPSRPQQQMYAANRAVQSPGYAVPNPLGLGGVPAPSGGGVGGAQTAAAPGGPSKTELLRSMYHQRQQQQQAQPQQQSQNQAVQQQPQNYRTAASGMSSAYQTNQTSTSHNQQRVASQPQQQNVQNTYQQQQQQMQRPSSQIPSQSHAQMQQLQQAHQQVQRQQAYQTNQPSGYNQQQRVASQPQQNVQNYQQQQPNRMNPQYQQQAQQQQRQASRSSSSQQQQGQGQSSSSGKKFHLTQAAKSALREAVLSAIRHPNGEVDKGCLERAMAQGLPQQAILNAAKVARARDRQNRQERSRAQQQRQGAQQQPAMQQPGMQQQVSPLVSRQQQTQQGAAPGQLVHQPRQGLPGTSPAKPQMQQMYPGQPRASGTTQYGQSAQYGQAAQYPGQPAQYRQQPPQMTQQQMQYQRQLQAQQTQQRKAQEEKRKQQALYKQQQEQRRRAQEQQRRAMEEERKRREMEAVRARAAMEAKRRGELETRMKPWGRTEFALVVKQGAKGIPQLQGIPRNAVLRQSTWGGASMCSDSEAALVSAMKRSSEGTESAADALPTKLPSDPEKRKASLDALRQRLLAQGQPLLKDEEENKPPTKEEVRRKRIAAMNSKLVPALTQDQMKRHKLQHKREGKFLGRHIRRARQITADGHTRRHKELLKAIVAHQSEFYKFHRVKKNEAGKLARAIRDTHKKAELAKEKEADNAERARIAALRANDMTAYTSLLEDTKNERLKYLLDKTDECMNQISTLLATRVAEEEEDIKTMGGEGTVKATFTENVTGGSYYETAHVKSEQVRQPSILVGGDLKEYQMGGLQWLVSLYNNRLNGILADEMGLGKTIQTIALIAYLIEVKQNLGPYLVIVPLSTLSNWVNEFAKWLPAAMVVCYKGSPQQRKALFRDEVADGHFNVLLTTYEFVIRDKGSLRKLAWQYAIVDEGHRMKNNQSKFSVTLGTHYNTRRRVLLTGTPLQNSLPELWALLNFLLPAIFNSSDTFDQWFNKPFSSFGKSSDADGDSSNELISNEERMLIIHRLHELLRPFMLRRVKSEVLDQLPEKVEKVLRCELSSWQKELYKQISHKIAGEAANNKNFNRGLNNVVMQLRKVANHPYLFSKEGYHINEDIIRTSGKMELLDRMLPKLKAAGHRILMFTQMTKMMPILEDYFAYRGFASLRLDGSTSADEREKRMYMFNAPDSPYFIFLLSTRAGGLGLNLATADTVIIFDSDWNPMMDLQAQDRAHRIGQRKDVRVFRIITQTPVEEKILSRATEKLQMNELVVEAGKFDKSGQAKEDNSLERLKMMELLLTDFDQNQSSQGAATSEEDFERDTDNGEEEGESKDLLNEMISSNNDDFKLYCKMDLERTDAPALYSDVTDCPDWILYPNGKPEEGAELIDYGQPEILGKRRAAAGDIKYDDGLTEKQFMRMMDKKAIAEEKDKKKRKKKRGHNSVDTSLIVEDGGGRKRTKTSHPELGDTKSRGAKAGGAFGNGEITPAMNDRLLSVTRSLIYFKDKASKRKLSDIFLEKPCPQTYPDYYQLIDKPIGMNDILRKCRAKLYSTVNEFLDDWSTLFKNARTYNGEGSWIVIDADTLKGELDRLMDKNALSSNAAASKKPVRLKLSLKSKKKK